MAKMSHTVCQRIRRIKNSLENAEQSFLDNKDVRGELDLMLAEAELSNLRRKKDVPWSWNRQLLALCAALAIITSCFGGWYYARHNVAAATEALPAAAGAEGRETAKAAAIPVQEQAKVPEAVLPARAEIKQEDITADMAQERQLKISDTDMRRLVKSARTELTSSK